VLLLAREARNEEENNSSFPAQRSRPLKKRKAFPCHVSPVSLQSLQASPDTPATTVTTQGSYGEEETSSNKKVKEEYVEEAKSRTSSPPSQVVIPFFPSVLHMLLSSSSSEKVIQWLPDGKAWRIVRWEALRRDILPQFFPQLRGDEKSSTSAGSIDAFFRHLTAWGFKEITEGQDVGAYTHAVSNLSRQHCNDQMATDAVMLCANSWLFFNLLVFVAQMFLRDKHELCRKMQQLVPKNRDESASHDDEEEEKVPENSRRSIIRFPSLATASTETPSFTSRRALSTETPSFTSASGHTFDSTPKGQEPASPRQQHHQQHPAWADQPVFVNYRPEEMIMQQQGSWQEQQQQQQGASMSRQGSWQQQQQQGGMMIRASQGMPPYSPIRIRSTRGRPSFGVSNRGRRMPPRSVVQRRLPLAGRSMSPPRYPSA
jgi:hypothetical protein